MTVNPIITHEHLLGFGGIIHNYAFVESGIKLASAHVAGIDLIDFMIMSEPYSSLQLRNVAKSLAKTHEPISKECERFIQIVGDFSPFSKIRNFIAHSRWTVGDRPNSIKPSGIDIREGKAKILGSTPGEQDWTPDELKNISDDLLLLSQRISSFLVETGVAESMASHMEHINKRKIDP